MTRTMYDGLGRDAEAIAKAFPGAQLAAGYVDGLFVWSQAEWDLFPHAQHVRITAIPGSSAAMSADVADCETGDYTPDSAAAWAHAKRAAGYDRPTIYCNLSTSEAVRVATGSLVLGVDYDLWIADWTGSSHSIRFSDGRSAAATQFESFSFYDISSVYNDAWPVRSSHNPPPPPKGPFRHVVPAGNTESLYKVAQDRNMPDSDEIISLTEANLGSLNLTAFQGYLAYTEDALAANMPHPAMGEGLVYYTKNA